MATSRFLIALLLPYLTPSSATSLPILPQAVSTDENFPIRTIPSNNSTNVTAPTPPPGFSTHLKFNSSVQLKPLEVYICAIELMHVLCNFPWTLILTLSMVMSGHDASTELVLNPFPPYSGSRLQVRYAVLGLYKMSVAIAQGNQFYELEAALYMGEEEVGWLELGPKSPMGSSGRLLALETDYANDTTTMMVMGDEGKIFDPDDGNFAVTFSWDGVRIKSQDIFTAILDSLAIAAEHKNTDVDAYIPAARSASGDTVLSTWTVGEGGNAEMTWARLKRALIMIWDILIVGRKGKKSRFEGLVFGFEYEGKGVGAGRMLRFNEEGGSDAGSASER